MKKKGSSLLDQSCDDFSQLSLYIGMVYNQLNWEIREQLIQIITEFLETKMASFELCEMLNEKLELTNELSDTLRFDIIDDKVK